MRFFVPGWPANLAGHSAVVPNLNRHAASGAQQYKDGVTGQPGTQAIPVDTQEMRARSGPSAQALMGFSRSRDCPDVFYPNMYYARPQGQFWPGAGMPVSYVSDNLMPVPAADPRGIPSTQQMPLQRVSGSGGPRGQFQVRTFPNLPTWPPVNAS